MAILKQSSVPDALRIHGEAVKLTLRRHASARRYSIRYRPLTHDILLTVPKRAPVKAGIEFALSKEAWLYQHITKVGGRRALEEGALVTVLGSLCSLKRSDSLRGVVTREDNIIYVPGDPAFFTRRLTTWLKKQLLAEIKRLTEEKSQLIGRKVRSVSLRDASSRWGSCSAEGDLMFSWRMVFAPYDVLDYLVAHEVAHLKEMNHSPRFWKIVEQLCPHHEASRSWLKTQGEGLYKYA